MGTLTKKLHILAGGTEETCDIYTTPEEVGGSPYLALEVDGTEGYVKLGSTTDANATHLRVEKNGTTYAAWKQAAEKEKAFIITAEHYTNDENDSMSETSYDVYGFGITPDSVQNHIGSITPEEIDGFKILRLLDSRESTYNFETGEEEDDDWFMILVNRKCILRIKGKDYRITHEYPGGLYEYAMSIGVIGIKDKEQIKVTYTLL